MSGKGIAGKLLAAVAICEGAGLLSSVFTVKSIPAWYDKLEKPAYTPPKQAFGPVWTTLYLLMGVSLFLVWRKAPQERKSRPALAAFSGQLALNALWSVAFFGLRSPFAGEVVIALLWLAILATIILFFPISVAAGSLLVPYIIWVSIATYLNTGIWLLNRPPRSPQP